MNFCKKCGVQIPEESTICPQCNTPTKTNNDTINHPTSPTKKFNKLFVIIPLIVIITALITTIGSYFTLLYLVDAFPNNNSDNTFVTVPTTQDCPNDEYGNHNWEPATCIEPSQCFNCKAYRDNKLATHHNWHNYDSGRACEDCNLSYDDYTSSKE